MDIKRDIFALNLELHLTSKSSKVSTTEQATPIQHDCTGKPQCKSGTVIIPDQLISLTHVTYRPVNTTRSSPCEGSSRN